MFIGRREYLTDLETLWRKRTSSIVACRGRRRIGKSTLIREFARRTADAYIEIEGLPPSDEVPVTNRDELDHFVTVLNDQTGCGFAPCERWYDAFSLLEKQIDDAKRTVVLLDEISWMGQCDPQFPGILRSAWETLFHRHDRLVLVLCGSVSGWIKDNILNNTGFTGRFSRDYVLGELSLAECAEFWGPVRDRVTTKEVFDVLSVTGGVPRYLEEMDPGLTAEENIRRTCFSPDGVLYKDFDAIFNPLYGKSVPEKRAILDLLCNGPMTGAELADATKRGRNGAFAKTLHELEQGGFVTGDPGLNPETGREARTSKYRLRDNYTRFYLKYVRPHRTEIEAGAYRHASLEHLPEWAAVTGLQFENLIVNNARELVPRLGLGNATVLSAAPYRNDRRTRDGRPFGCQVDLLVQTARTAYVVEIKRMNRIGPEIEAEVAEKLRRLPVRPGTSKRPVLVYAGELAKSVEADGFFDTIIPARCLLEMEN